MFGNKALRLSLAVAVLAGISILPTPATGVTLSASNEVCTIVGTDLDDFLVGTTGDDVICGFEGDDVISGLDGSDTILGGIGNDEINAGSGNDKLFGGEGNDELTGEIGEDYSEGGPGADKLFGGDGSDALLGGDGDDQIIGGAASDSLSGGNGIDYCEKDKKDASVSSCFYDSSPPKLISVAIATKTIDTSLDNAVLILRARVSDKGTGVGSIGFNFQPRGLPGSDWSINFGTSIDACEAAQPNDPTTGQPSTGCRVSGDQFDGVYEARMLIPLLSPKATYSLMGFTAADAARNTSSLETKELKAKKMAVTFKQIGPGDSTKPKISAFQMITKSVNTNSNVGIVSFRVRASDSGSGLRFVSGSFAAESKNRSLDFGGLNWNVDFSDLSSLICENGIARDPNPGERYSACIIQGNQFGAIISVKLRLPQYSPKVDYRMNYIGASDNVQNVVQHLDVKPWNKVIFKQKGAGDSKTPKITQISVMTPVVDASTSAQESIIRVKFSDDLSGVRRLELGFSPINISNFVFFAFDSNAQKCNENRSAALPGGSCLISGSLKSGVIEMKSVIPAHAPRGSFYLQQALITDRADNGSGCGRDSCHESNIITTFSVKNIQIKNGS